MKFWCGGTAKVRNRVVSWLLGLDRADEALALVEAAAKPLAKPFLTVFGANERCTRS